MLAQSYDIFRRDAGAQVWVEAARDLESAKSRVIELAAEEPGQYVVVNQRSGRMVSSGTVLASPAARTTAVKETENAGDADAESTKADSETLW
jgi:hypothetical protein